MRFVMGLLALAVAWNQACGTPPETGGFMTGPDYSRYVYWYHPAIHAYEQGRDDQVDELNLASGDDSGEYCIVQKTGFPFMSYISEFLVKINMEDLYPELPGDQFSPFGVSVYADGDDSLPSQPALWKGTNSLCGGQPCGDPWVENFIGWLNLEGEEFWFGLEWADTTPSAPQVKCFTLQEAGLNNKLGVGSDGFYVWHEIMYSAAFRYRFLSPIPVDTSGLCGWCRSLDVEERPDGFQINCFNKVTGTLINRYRVGCDTLYFRLPTGDCDSVEISAVYGDVVEGVSLAMGLDESLITPVTASLDFGKGLAEPGAFDLIITNTGPSSLALSLGFDELMLAGEARELALDAYETAAIPFQTPLTESDSLDLLIVISDITRQYYPFWVCNPYPPACETDVFVVDEGEESEVKILEIYPNPFQGTAAMMPRGLKRPAEVIIYNILGQEVAQMPIFPNRSLHWDGRDDQGRTLPAGIYLVRLMENERPVSTGKIVIFR